MSVEDLWPEGMGVKVLSPRAILLAQATNLAKRTQNVVKARLVDDRYPPSRSAPGIRLDAFEIYSEAAQYSEPVLMIEYQARRVYPVLVFSNAFNDLSEISGGPFHQDLNLPGWACSNQEQFADLLREIFSSKETLSLIDSILAVALETPSANA